MLVQLRLVNYVLMDLRTDQLALFLEVFAEAVGSCHRDEAHNFQQFFGSLSWNVFGFAFEVLPFKGLQLFGVYSVQQMILVFGIIISPVFLSDHTDSFPNDCVCVVGIVELLAVLKTFIVDGLKHCHLAPQQHPHLVPAGCYCLHNAPFRVHFGVHEL